MENSNDEKKTARTIDSESTTVQASFLGSTNVVNLHSGESLKHIKSSKVDYSGDKLTTRMLLESLQANEYHIIEEKFPTHYCVVTTRNSSLPRVTRPKPDRDANEMTILDVSFMFVYE